MKSIGKTLLGLGVLLLLVTLASLVPTNWWLIQALDLVREPAAYAITVLMLVGLLLGSGFRSWIAALYGAAALINVWCIWPYSAFASTELELVDGASDEQCFTAMSANVLMDNPDFAGIIEQVERVDPDVLLLTETNAEWIRELRPLTSKYPHVREHPQEDTFGKIFASRIPVIDTDVVERAGEDTPTVYGYLRASESGIVRFIGLHHRERAAPEGGTKARRAGKRPRHSRDTSSSIHGVLSRANGRSRLSPPRKRSYWSLIFP